MTDVFDPAKRSAVMRRVKGRDTTPELVAVIAAAFLGERMSARGWIGVALVGIGAVVVATS